jgi:hypothetical protein
MEEEENEFSKLYSERQDWSDIKPVSLDEGPRPFAPIAYSQTCAIPMNLEWFGSPHPHFY